MNVHEIAASANHQKQLTVIEESPPIAAVWLSRFCWVLSAIALYVIFVGATERWMQLHNAASPIERLEVVVSQSGGITQSIIVAATCAILAMLFNLRATMKQMVNSLTPRKNRGADGAQRPGEAATICTEPQIPQHAVLVELQAIRAELAWQRQLKEKEVHRAKAAAATQKNVPPPNRA